MSYKDKFEEYKKGNLSHSEMQEIENDIEKFAVLMEYFDEKIVSEPAPLLPSSDDEFSFSEQIDKFINRRIKKSTINTLLVIILFAAFFLIGIGGQEVLRFLGLSQGAAHFLFGLFSAAYYFVNFWLLYTSFTRKKLKPAIFIIIWNIALIILTVIFSMSMGDAVPFAMPIILGFSTLPQYFADIFDSNDFYNAMNNIGLLMIPINIIISVIAIVFSKKAKVFRPVSKKNSRFFITIFLAFSIALSGVSTAVNYYKGFFPEDRLGSKLAEKTIYELDDVFIKSNPLDKTDEELKEILVDLGYEYFTTNISYLEGYYRKGRSDNMTASFYFGENNNEYHRNLNINFSYDCVNPYIKQDKMKRISEGQYFKIGDDETYVMKELCSFGLYPHSIEYIESGGERFTSCKVIVSVKKNTSYPNGYDDWFEFEFENGKLSFFDSFAVDES